MTKTFGIRTALWRLSAIALAALIALPAAAEDPKRGDRAPSEEVEPFYGNFEQRIPIEVPAFHGIEPDLSLSYRSSRRDGALGLGWTLGGISTIEAASPRRGTPNYNSSDIFILDGRELVACEVGMASPSCDTGGTHATKIESYLRIKLDTTNNRWEVWNREGTKIVFEAVTGLDPLALAFANTFRWAISEVVDTHGNTVTFSYFNDAGESYPESVSYNGSEVQFFWEERPDPYSTAMGQNGLAESFQRLKSVAVKTGGNLVRAYALTYDAARATTGRALLASVQLYGSDATVGLDGTVSGGTSLPATAFGYYDTAESLGAATNWSTAHSSIAYGGVQVQYADVNGDNKADRIFRHTDNKIYVSLSNGTAFDAPVLWVSIGGTYRSDQDSYADADGDGLTDLIFRKSDNQIGIYLSTGSAFSAPLAWTAMGGTYYEGQAQFGDVDGDGKADLVFRSIASSSCVYQTVTAYSSCSSNPPYPPYPSCPEGYEFVSHVGQFTTPCGGDDGGNERRSSNTYCKSCSYTDTIKIGISTGTSFTTPVDALPGAINPAGPPEADQMKLADLNGDGRVDFSYRNGNNEVLVGLSIGTGFQALSTWITFEGNYRSGQLQYADVNGDGTADAIFREYIEGACTQVTVESGTQCSSPPPYPACPSGYSLISQWSGQDGVCGAENPRYRAYTTCSSCASTQDLQVALSTGGAFQEAIAWYTGLLGNAGNFEQDQVKLGDFNGDGRADFSFRGTSNAITLGLSTGSGFNLWTVTAALGGGYASDQIQHADVNGDGRDDLLHRATNQTTKALLSGPVAEAPEALKTVENAFGGTSTITYTPSSVWTNTRLPFVVHTVTSLAADDGRGNTTTTTYTYDGGLWDAPERRFLGFHSAKATLPCNAGEVQCPTREIWFKQDFGSLAKVEKIERRDGAGTLLEKIEEEYTLNGAAIPYTSLNTASWRTVYEGVNSKRSKVTRAFDAYANVVETTHHSDFDVAGDEVTTATDFPANTTGYLVSLPGRIKRYAGVGTGGVCSQRPRSYTTAPPTGPRRPQSAIPPAPRPGTTTPPATSPAAPSSTPTATRPRRSIHSAGAARPTTTRPITSSRSRRAIRSTSRRIPARPPP